jgi:dinuclear metal center YbgI/SA1388 family protein
MPRSFAGPRSFANDNAPPQVQYPGRPMILRDLLPILDAIAPLRWAEPWDNTGLLTGEPDAPIARALLTIDLTHAVMDEAVARRSELVVAYHPALFEAVKRVRHDSVIYRAIRAGVAVYSPHTALDAAPGGTNDVLADALGLTERAPLKLTSPAEGQGIGRVGKLPARTPRAALLAQVKRALSLSALLVAGPTEGDCERAAVCAGAGRGLLDEALAQKVDLYLTGELPHHDALKASAAGVTVVCALHSNSERATLLRLKARLDADAPGVEVLVSDSDRDPYRIA